jgi:AcrR family transcriptional regulator
MGYVAYATEREKLVQNSEEKVDLRVRRSRKMLQEALIELTVEKKGFTAVTVQDITERAMVNRSTFYRHYLDKCDLVQQYMADVFAFPSGEKVEVTLEADQTRGPVPSGLLNLLKHVQEYADFYRIMLSADGDPGFTEDFRQNLEKRFRTLVADQQGTEASKTLPVEMRIKYVTYAGVGAIVWWLENEQPCSVEQLASWISRLSYPIWSGTMR